jgi:phosphoacetylglucosamine mutase
MKENLKRLEAAFVGVMQVTIINDDENPDLLNEGCGAEFVHKDQKFPTHFDKHGRVGLKCASFDGDADRLIYFYQRA